MNKLTKNLLRIWISTTSVIAFAAGWIALAHAPKPAPLDIQSVAILSSIESPTTDSFDLEPVPSLEGLLQGSVQTATSQRSFNFNLPRLRTRGS